MKNTKKELTAAAKAAQETMIVVKKANGKKIFWDGADRAAYNKATKEASK